MLFKESKIKDLYYCEYIPNKDERGYFVRTQDRDILIKYNWNKIWVQENESLSMHKGTIRGFHMQLDPYSEAKQIRPVQGSIFTSFIDLRFKSPTFGQYESYILDSKKPSCVLVPRGLACGICTLEDNTIIQYKMDNKYFPPAAIGIKWDDPDIGVVWPQFDELHISEKDQKNMTFKEFMEKFKA